MARKPDVPCADCGKLLMSGKGSLPVGQRRCHPCRKKGAHRVCTGCGKDFASMRRAAGGRRRRTCSPDCAARVRSRGVSETDERPCSRCGIQIVMAPRRYCPECKAAIGQARARRKNAVRRGAAAVGRTLTIAELGERDRWRCHLCLRRVSRTFKSPHPRSPSFDHLIPVSDGGTDAPENLRLAHRWCNSSRGARGTVQLMLVG